MVIGGPGTEGAASDGAVVPFDELWERLVRPFDLSSAVAALTALPLRAVEQLLGVAISTAPEAQLLLQSFPRTVRSLATSVKNHPQRCVGSLRGPVLWSETMSARSASFGDTDLYVCATPSRAYDVDENQVLVYALTQLREAGSSAVRAAGAAGGHDPDIRLARDNAVMASRCLDHPSLREVTGRRPRARALTRTRTSKHRKWYAPAVQMIDRVRAPLSQSDIRDLCDERTRAQHHVLLGVLNRLEFSRGRPLPGIRVDGGGLECGPVRFHGARHRGDRSPVGGIRVGRVLIDVPDRLHDPNRRRALDLLRARAGDDQAVLVMDERDIDRAVELVIELEQETIGV